MQRDPKFKATVVESLADLRQKSLDFDYSIAVKTRLRERRSLRLSTHEQELN
jgi:hypothetical protein